MYTDGALLIHFPFMSQPLTLEHFDETMRSIAETLADHSQRFDRIDATLADHTALLADHTKRLTRIEDMLWQGERIIELERRVGKLAERTGNADLAVPLQRPLGT